MGFARVGFARVGFARVGFARVGFARGGFARGGFARGGFARGGFARRGLRSSGASLVGASLSDRSWLEAKRNDRSWLVDKEFNTEVEEGPFAAHRRQEDSSGRKKIRGSSGTPLRSLPTTTSGCRISTLLTPYRTRCCGSSGFSSASAPSTRRHLSMCRELTRRYWGCSSSIQSILLLHLSFSEGEQNSAAGN